MPSPILVLLAYGSAVVISGCLRFALAEGGATGLWFGLVMGAVVFLSAALHARRHPRLGKAGAAFALCTVGGWFTYEAFVRKGFADAEWRQLILIAMSLVTAWCLFVAPWPGQSRRASAP